VAAVLAGLGETGRHCGECLAIVVVVRSRRWANSRLQKPVASRSCDSGLWSGLAKASLDLPD
jgi:hypothetical protein